MPEKKYTPLVQEKKGSFNTTFHNLSKASSKDQLKITDIYKAKETPPKKTVSTVKKASEKVTDKLTFYQQLQAKPIKKSSDNKQSLEYSNYPTSRQNSRIFGQEENLADHTDKRPPVMRNNLVSQKDFAELLSDVVFKDKTNNFHIDQKNLPYIIKGMTKYMPSKSKNIGHPFSNNSSFYNVDEEKAKNQEIFLVDEKRLKLNQEDYSKPVSSRDVESSKKHRRGYSMGQPSISIDKNYDLERQLQLEKLEKQLQFQYQQQQEKNQQAVLQYQQQQQQQQLQQQ